MQVPHLLISAPSLGVLLFFCRWLCLSVCMCVHLSVCHKHCFCFVSRWNQAISWLSVLHDKNYKTLFFDFWFRPPNVENLIPKICTKSTKSACMVDRPEMFAPTKGFSGMADSMEPCKMLLGRPLLPWQRNLG